MPRRKTKSERSRELGGKAYRPVTDTESARRNVQAITKEAPVSDREETGETGFTAGPMQPVTEYERTGEYPSATIVKEQVPGEQVLTREQLLGQYMNPREFITGVVAGGQQRQQLQNQYESINPQNYYRYRDPDTGEMVSAPGYKLRYLIKQQIESTGEQRKQFFISGLASTSSRAGMVQQTEDYPEGTRFVVGPGGTVAPEMRLVRDEDKIAYYKSRGVFVDPQSGERVGWSEYKSRNPAAFMTVENGRVRVVTDYVRWNEERYQGSDPFMENVSRGLSRFLGGFANPEFIIETVGRGGSGDEIIARWEYEQQQRIKKGDAPGFVAGVPVVTNVFVPAVGGAVVGGLMRGGQAVTRLVLQRFGENAAKISNVLQKGVAGGLAGGFAVKEGIEFVGTPDEKKLERLLTTGTQFASFYAGMRLVQEWSPEVRIAETKEGNLVAQKFVTTVRGKPVLPYGKPLYLGAVGESGYARIVSPVPSRGGLEFQTPEQFLKTKVQPFQRQGLVPVKARPSSIFDIPMESSVAVVSRFNEKTFMDFGKKWQPFVESQFPLSTRVLPKPVVRKKPGKLVTLEDVIPSYVTESDLLVKKIISQDWQPQTGIKRPISEIETQEELFSVYKKGKITTSEYQIQRDIIKGRSIEKETQKIFDQPKTKMMKDRSPIYPPIFMDVVPGGGIVTKQYGTTFWETGKVKKPFVESQFPLSTRVLPKPVVRKKPGKLTVFEFPPPIVPVLESGGIVGLFEIKTKPVVSKAKTKIVTLNDLRKKGVLDTVEKDVESLMGDTDTGQMLILEPQQIKIVKQKKLVKQKQVVKQKPLLEKDVVTIEKEMGVTKQVYEKPVTRAISDKKSIDSLIKKEETSIGMIFGYAQGKTQRPVQIKKIGVIPAKQFETGQIQFIQQDSIRSQIQQFETGQLQGMTQGYEKQIVKTTFDDVLPFDTKKVKPKKGRQVKPGFPVFPTVEQIEKTMGVSTGNMGYDVFVKPRQYRSGKKIREGRFNIKVNKQPLSREQALNLGHNIVDKNEKASFKIIQTGEKASKKKIGGERFWDHFFDYNDKGNGVYTERSKARIDSIGELREITFKGIKARRKSGGKNIERMVQGLSNRQVIRGMRLT